MADVQAKDPIGFGSHGLPDDMVAVYTDGFAALGAPELVVTGHREQVPNMAQAFYRMVSAMFVGGTGSVPAAGTLGAFGPIPIYFGDATPHAGEIAPDLLAKSRRLGHALAVTQLVISDPDGRLPWETDAYECAQVLFCSPPPVAVSTATH